MPFSNCSGTNRLTKQATKNSSQIGLEHTDRASSLTATIATNFIIDNVYKRDPKIVRVIQQLCIGYGGGRSDSLFSGLKNLDNVSPKGKDKAAHLVDDPDMEDADDDDDNDDDGRRTRDGRGR